MLNPKNAKWILVTGASSGIGRATAEYLARNGFHVYACARQETDLKSLGALENVISIKMDVTSAEEVTAAVKFVEGQGTGLFGLVNNAGLSFAGILIETPVEDIISLFAVNVFGMHRVTRAFFPLILEAKGRIVNISSGNGFFAYPFTGPYNMSKFSVEAYTETLRRELIFKDVKFILINPGQVKTPIWDKTVKKGMDDLERLRKDTRLPELIDFGKVVAKNVMEGVQKNAIPPERIAEAIHEALIAEQPKLRYLVPNTRFQYKMMKLLPESSLDKMVKKQLEKMRIDS